MSPIVIILVAAYVFYRVIKFMSEKQETAIAEKKADLEDSLEMIEEYRFKDENTTYTFNFAKMTLNSSYCIDDYVSESDFVLSKRNDVWFVALTNQKIDGFMQFNEVVNSKITPEFLAKYPPDHFEHEYQIGYTNKLIAGIEIASPVLRNTLIEQLNIYNEKKAVLLRKVS